MLAIFANVASIATALVTAVAGASYWVSLQRKRCKLEEYLRAEKLAKNDNGLRTVLHLVAHVGMTESEIIQASFRSKHIERKIGADQTTGRAAALLLGYKD